MDVLGYTESGMIRIEIDGAEATVPDDMANRYRQQIAEWEFDEDGERINTIPAYSPPPLPVSSLQPSTFAAMAVCIENGAVAMLEMAAQLQSAFYEGGWLMVSFSEPQDESKYLIFAQTDVPARIEQFKSGGFFELVFSDGNGDPIEPSRIDLQILKVG